MQDGGARMAIERMRTKLDVDVDRGVGRQGVSARDVGLCRDSSDKTRRVD